MNPKVTLFGDLLRFSPACLCLSLTAAALFLLHWRLTYERTGWKLDYWFFMFFWNLFLPIIFFYPTSGSILQFTVLGDWFDLVDNKIDQAFEISLFGCASVVLGRFVFDSIGHRRSSAIVSSAFASIEATTYRNVRSGAATLLLLILIIPVAGVVFHLSAQAGFYKAAYYFQQEGGGFRSLYNLLLVAYPLFLVYYWLQHRDTMSRTKWAIWILLLLASATLGTRGSLVSTILIVYPFSAYAKGGRISFTRTVLFFSGVAVLAILLGAIRNSSSSSSSDVLRSIGFNLFYGNNLSDLRDFAWGLAAWDGNFWQGKTYLAGVMAFVPQVLSPFRDKWAVGVVTARLIGFSPSEHPGIRLGPFGEAYMNFGLIGVLIVGLINGFALRYADVQIKQRISAGENLTSAYVATIPYYFSSALYITVSFSAVYSFIIIQFLALCLRVCLRPQPVLGPGHGAPRSCARLLPD